MNILFLTCSAEINLSSHTVAKALVLRKTNTLKTNNTFLFFPFQSDEFKYFWKAVTDFWSVHAKHFTLAKGYMDLFVKAKGNNHTGEDSCVYVHIHTHKYIYTCTCGKVINGDDNLHLESSPGSQCRLHPHSWTLQAPRPLADLVWNPCPCGSHLQLTYLVQKQSCYTVSIGVFSKGRRPAGIHFPPSPMTTYF